MDFNREFARFLLAFFGMMLLLALVSTAAWMFVKAGEKTKLVEVLPPEEVYWDRFLYQPEAWNRVFWNMSEAKGFWNATLPSGLAGKSIGEIAEMFGGPARHSMESSFVIQRKSAARKLQSSRINRIRFHTFRHWKDHCQLY